MAGNLMKRAATYRKSHKSLSMAQAVKKVAAMDRAKKGAGGRKKKAAPKKRATKKRAVKKRAAPKKRATKKRAAVGKVHRKKAAPRKKASAAKKSPRKVKIKVKRGGNVSLGISGINHAKVGHELRHKQSLESALKRHQGLLKAKGLTPGEKAQIRNDIKRYRHTIAESKKHITELKKHI